MAFSEYWMCFKCWIFFHVPTTGYFGTCPECHKETIPTFLKPSEFIGRLVFQLQTGK